MRISRRLREPMIEAAPTGARGMDEQPVEYLAILLVAIESLEQEVSQETPRLGYAEGDAMADGERRGRIVPGVGHHVADRGQPQAHQRGVAADVDELVDPARLKAAVQGNPAAVPIVR